MKFVFNHQYKKQYQKLPQKIKSKCNERLALFVTDSTHQLLRVHKLTAEYKGCFSLNVTADIRIVCKEITSDCVQLLAVGTHSKLYK